MQLSASSRPAARASTAGLVTPAAIAAAVNRAQADAGASASGRPARKPAAVASASTKGVEGAEAIIESPTGAFEPFVVHYAETFIVPAAVGDSAGSPLASPSPRDYAASPRGASAARRHRSP